MGLVTWTLGERPGHRINQTTWGWACTCGFTYIGRDRRRFSQQAATAAAVEHLKDTYGSLNRNKDNPS